jgi:hypothetical protein
MKPTYRELNEALQLVTCSYIRLLQDLHNDYEIDGVVTLLNLGVSVQQDLECNSKPKVADIITLLKLVHNKSSDDTTRKVL